MRDVEMPQNIQNFVKFYSLSFSKDLISQWVIRLRIYRDDLSLIIKYVNTCTLTLKSKNWLMINRGPLWIVPTLLYEW